MDFEQRLAVDRILRKRLEQGGQIRLEVRTSSMAPLILPRDFVTIRKVSENEIRPGMILALRSVDGYVVHRLISRTDQEIKTRGDRLAELDPPCSTQEILGQVVLIEGADRTIDLQKSLGKLRDWQCQMTARLKNLRARLKSALAIRVIQASQVKIFRSVFLKYYDFGAKVTARIALIVFGRCSIFARGSYAQKSALPGVSDIDFTLVTAMDRTGLISKIRSFRKILRYLQIPFPFVQHFQFWTQDEFYRLQIDSREWKLLAQSAPLNQERDHTRARNIEHSPPSAFLERLLAIFIKASFVDEFVTRTLRREAVGFRSRMIVLRILDYMAPGSVWLDPRGLHDPQEWIEQVIASDRALGAWIRKEGSDLLKTLSPQNNKDYFRREERFFVVRNPMARTDTFVISDESPLQPTAKRLLEVFCEICPSRDWGVRILSSTTFQVQSLHTSSYIVEAPRSPVRARLAREFSQLILTRSYNIEFENRPAEEQRLENVLREARSAFPEDPDLTIPLAQRAFKVADRFFEESLRR